MKLRMGFVSNSSSSCFITVVVKELNDEVMKKLPQYAQDCMKELLSETVLLGRQVVYMGDMDTQGGDSYTFYEFDHTLDGKYVDDGEEPSGGKLPRPDGEYSEQMNAYDAMNLWQETVRKVVKESGRVSELFEWGLS